MSILKIKKIMNLINHILTCYILIVLCAYIQQANAMDGTVTIQGKVTAQTCTINSGSDKGLSVELPEVSKKLLAKSGATAIPVPFAIQFSQCAAGSKIAAYFKNGNSVDENTGRLNNTASADAASNVQIQLLNQDLQLIPLNYSAVAGSSLGGQQASMDSDGSAILRYALRYFSVGEATAGSVISSINYMISYE